MSKRMFFALVLPLVLSSCTWLHISKTPTDRVDLNLPPLETIEVLPVRFIVLTDQTVTTKFDELKKEGKEPVLLAITLEDYKNLSINIENIKQFVVLQGQYIGSYRKYYEGKGE